MGHGKAALTKTEGLLKTSRELLHPLPAMGLGWTDGQCMAGMAGMDGIIIIIIMPRIINTDWLAGWRAASPPHPSPIRPLPRASEHEQQGLPGTGQNNSKP